MDDDLDTPKALNEIMKFSKKVNRNLNNKKEILEESGETIRELGGILGLEFKSEDKVDFDEEFIETLIGVRNDLREKGDYETSDRIRSGLMKAGIQLEDEEGETVWKHK